MKNLSHVDEAGSVRMVDVGGKPVSRRRAIATATVRMASETARQLQELPKGDALATAQVAGTVYDMAKAIDKEMVIGEVRLVEKTKEPV